MGDADSDAGFWEDELRRFLPDAREALRKAFGYACCPICYVLADVPFDYFAVLPRRWPEEEHVRAAVCRARGFCNRHTWRLFGMQSLVTIARVFVDVLDALPGQQSPPHRCPVCHLQSLMEDALLGDLCEWLSERSAQEHYGKLFGVCYPHLEMLLQRDTAEGIRELLIGAQEAQRERLSRSLRCFLDKETTGAKWTRTEDDNRAPKRALFKVAGNQEV